MTDSRPRARSRRRQNIIAAIVIAILFGGGAALWIATQPGESASNGDKAGGREGRGRGGPGGPGGRPQPVTVAEVRRTAMPLWVAAIGTVTPRNLVTVRSRVDGELVKVHFREGQTVQAGDVLAEIDPRPFEVQLAQASGQLARDQALLQNAELDLQRYRDLWAKDSIAKQQLDTQEAQVRQYRGTVESDKGAVENARLQLAYARIVAPISGRVGLRQVDPGNQVRAGDANGIASIAQMQPITIVFAVPEGQLPAINKRLGGRETIRVEAWDREQKNLLATGQLLTTDNQIDAATGTIKLKAEFANKDNVLFPNQFVNVRLLLGSQENALVVPVAAIQRGAGGSFVYTVDAEATVANVPVKPGASEGERVAVTGDIKAGERVVTDGGDRLRPGAKVEIVTPGGGNGPPGGASKAGGDRPPWMDRLPPEVQEKVAKMTPEERREWFRKRREERQGGGGN